MQEIKANLQTEGIIHFESEMVAIFNLILACGRIIGSRTSIKEDVRSLNLIQKDPNFFAEDGKRRQMITLKVAIANKQTV